jgi:hypothetical protein
MKREKKLKNPSALLRRLSISKGQTRIFKNVFSCSGRDETESEAEKWKAKGYYIRVIPGYFVVEQYNVIKGYNLYVHKK